MSFTLAFFFPILISCSLLLHWWIFWLGLAWSPVVNLQMLPFYYHSQTQIGKSAVSADTYGDSGQLQVTDLLLEWCVAYSRMSKSRICCRPGLNSSHLPYSLPLHSKMWHSRLDVNYAGVTLLRLYSYCSVVYIHVVVSQLQTLNRVQRECVVAACPWPTKHRGFETHLHVQPLLH